MNLRLTGFRCSYKRFIASKRSNDSPWHSVREENSLLGSFYKDVEFEDREGICRSGDVDCMAWSESMTIVAVFASMIAGRSYAGRCFLHLSLLISGCPFCSGWHWGRVVRFPFAAPSFVRHNRRGRLARPKLLALLPCHLCCVALGCAFFCCSVASCWQGGRLLAMKIMFTDPAGGSRYAESSERWARFIARHLIRCREAEPQMPPLLLPAPRFFPSHGHAKLSLLHRALIRRASLFRASVTFSSPPRMAWAAWTRDNHLRKFGCFKLCSSRAR